MQTRISYEIWYQPTPGACFVSDGVFGKLDATILRAKDLLATKLWNAVGVRAAGSTGKWDYLDCKGAAGGPSNTHTHTHTHTGKQRLIRCRCRETRWRSGEKRRAAC